MHSTYGIRRRRLASLLSSVLSAARLTMQIHARQLSEVTLGSLPRGCFYSESQRVTVSTEPHKGGLQEINRMHPWRLLLQGLECVERKPLSRCAGCLEGGSGSLKIVV